MSKTTKTVIWVVLIVAIIIFVASLMQNPSMGGPMAAGQQKGAQGENGAGKNMPAMSAADDTSDEALAQDTASLDAKLTAIETAQAAGPANGQE